MKTVNMLALLLVVIGALNWGLVGLFDVDLVAMLFGETTTLTKLVYDLVGVSALYVAVTMLPKAAK